MRSVSCSVTPLSDRIPRLYDAVSHIWWQKSTSGGRVFIVHIPAEISVALKAQLEVGGHGGDVLGSVVSSKDQTVLL
jgi:hypothetical protein